MLLKLYQTGHPLLRQSAKLVSKKVLLKPKTQEFIDLMVETLRDAPGVGIAAPQVGQLLRIIVIEDKAKYHKSLPKQVLKAQGRKAIPLTVLVNPNMQITDQDEDLFFEGCLSIDGYTAAVARAKKVKLTAWDRHGRSISYTADGWHARILQHELEHLNGKLYIDTMKTKSFMSIKNFSILWRDALQPKIEKTFNS